MTDTEAVSIALSVHGAYGYTQIGGWMDGLDIQQTTSKCVVRTRDSG